MKAIEVYTKAIQFN